MAHKSKTSGPPMHVLTRIGVGVVLTAFAGIVTANAFGWVATLPGAMGQVMAFVGCVCAIFAFVAVPHVELYWKRKDWARLAVMCLFLAGAVATDFSGTERAIAHYFNAETQRQQAAAFDHAYGDLQGQIDALQSRIDAVPAPDLSGGPRNDAQAISARESLIAPLRDQLNSKVADQRTLHRPAPPTDPILAALLALIGEAVVTLGLFAFGWKVPGTDLDGATPQRVAPRPRKPRTGATRGKQGGKQPVDTAVIYRLRDRGLVEREIASETGISKSQVNRHLRARSAQAS